MDAQPDPFSLSQTPSSNDSHSFVSNASPNDHWNGEKQGDEREAFRRDINVLYAYFISGQE
jgi:hypothetical protein